MTDTLTGGARVKLRWDFNIPASTGSRVWLGFDAGVITPNAYNGSADAGADTVELAFGAPLQLALVDPVLREVEVTLPLSLPAAAKVTLTARIGGAVADSTELLKLQPWCAPAAGLALCGAHGVCDGGAGGCVCDAGYTGAACETATAPACEPDRTESSAVAEDGAVTCVCKEGFAGARCELVTACEALSPAPPAVCANGALRALGGADGLLCGACACPAQWTGALCDVCALAG